MASTKREKELARQRAERQAARRAAAAQRAKQRRAVVAGLVAVLLVIGVAVAAIALTRDAGGEDVAAPPAASPVPSDAAEPETSSETSPETSPVAAAPVTNGPGCAYPEGGRPPIRPVTPPPTEGVETEQVYDVTLATTQGDIVFEMDSAEAPCTANSLRALAESGYFDDTPCHRLTSAGISVLQCGDPTGTGSGGPGYSFADENLEGATYPRGTVAMANAGPDTNGSQFFLVYEDSALPPQYTPFGTVTSGLEVLDEIAAGGSEPAGDGKPVLPVEIETLTVTPQA